MYHLLTRHAPKVEQQIDLTVAQMKGFADLCGLVVVPPTNHTAVRQVEQAKAEQKLVEMAKSSTCEVTEARISNRVNGYGVDNAERRINQLQKVVKEVDQQYSMLIYDIPTSMNEECPNPSRTLWNYGFRLNLSCWVLPERGLNSHDVKELIALWKSHGLETHVIQYSKEAMGQIREIARTKLREEIVRVHQSLIERIGNASDRYKEAEKELLSRATPATAADFERLEALRIGNVRGALTAAGQALEASVNCARMFDEEENVKDLLKGLRAAVASEKASLAFLLENRTKA
jgi:hypothetical protein